MHPGLFTLVSNYNYAEVASERATFTAEKTELDLQLSEVQHRETSTVATSEHRHNDVLWAKNFEGETYTHMYISVLLFLDLVLCFILTK